MSFYQEGKNLSEFNIGRIITILMLGVLLGLLLPIVVLTILAGCTSSTSSKCAYSCKYNYPAPTGCYCFTEEIKYELENLQRGK